MQRQTTIAKANEIQRKWYVIDATDKPLGRLASQVAQVLTGKNKPTWTPNVDCGDYVIVINCEKVSLSQATNYQPRNITMFLVITVVSVQEPLKKWSKNTPKKCSKDAFTVWFQKDA